MEPFSGFFIQSLAAELPISHKINELQHCKIWAIEIMDLDSNTYNLLIAQCCSS